MAKAKKKRFAPIVINTLEQLEAIVNNFCTPLTSDEIAVIRDDVDPKSKRGLLKAWLKRTGITVCDDGFENIVAEAGNLSSWKDYAKAHWSDSDFKGWLQGHPKLVGKRSLSRGFGWGTTFVEFLDYNPGLRWASWPFGRAKARRKAKRR